MAANTRLQLINPLAIRVAPPRYGPAIALRIRFFFLLFPSPRRLELLLPPLEDKVFALIVEGKNMSTPNILSTKYK
ncbi:hypothetical protein Pfo_003440 [Paulownia fortunei]|nr:hypothetical protein Pfo_003440 [Paulownia fortunei]